MKQRCLYGNNLLGYHPTSMTDCGLAVAFGWPDLIVDEAVCTKVEISGSRGRWFQGKYICQLCLIGQCIRPSDWLQLK